MGDRCYLTVTIREEYYPLIAAYFKENPDKYYNCIEDLMDEVNTTEGLTEFEVYEANYGNHYDLTNPLEYLKIPYDQYWGAGDEYGAGNKYLRFDDVGNPHMVEVYESDEGKVLVDVLLKKIREEEFTSVEDIKMYLEKEQAKEQPFNGQENLAEIPIRELTDKESALIMEYKLKGE